MYISEWNQGINMSSSLLIYRELKSSFEISQYLVIIQNRKLRNALAKLRLSSHQLCIETGRHRNIERVDRKCIVCNLNDIEDEVHFTLMCPAYADLRRQYIHNYFYNRPSVHKYTVLLNSSKLTVLKNLALYVIKAFKLRDNLLNTMQ